MKPRSFTCLCTALALLVMAVVPASAMIPNKVEASVPFEFVVSGRTLPAGVYTFDTSPDLRMMRVWRNNKAQALLPVAGENSTKTASTTPQIVFQKKAGKYILAGVR